MAALPDLRAAASTLQSPSPPPPSASFCSPSLCISFPQRHPWTGSQQHTWVGLRSIGSLSDALKQTSRNPVQSQTEKTHHRARSVQLGSRALFTGIVEEMGKVRGVRVTERGGYEMSIAASTVVEDVKLGDSIAVNGTCLTVTAFDSKGFSVGLGPETLRRTSLGEACAGSPVNLERAMQPSSRMGGHFVQGHVDGTGIIVSFDPEGDSVWVKVKACADVLRYVVPKGYIAVDGTSLTVVGVYDEESSFTVMLVDYTQRNIVLSAKKIGNKVNLEVDIVGKYVERLLKAHTKS